MFNVPEEAIKVLGDVDAITQVIYNLLDNAIKFSRENSPLTISLWKDSKKAYVSIRNCGSTIPEAEIPLLFDRFHKSDRSRAGPHPSGEAKEKNARVGHCADPCRRGGAHHRLVSALPEQRRGGPQPPRRGGRSAERL